MTTASAAMPTKSKAKRARLSSPSSESKSKSKDNISRTRRSRPLKQWRTSGIVDKQSTLTQIDFVRSANRFHDEDWNPDHEDEDTILVADVQEPTPKRRKIEVVENLEVHNTGKNGPTINSRASDDKENQYPWLYNSVKPVVKPGFLTPRKPRNREVRSSQSPITPLSIRSTRHRLIEKHDSPLKDISTNILHQPRLLVEDSYKTTDSESTLSLTSPALAETHSPKSMRKPTLRDSGTDHQTTDLTRKSEILDSDEDLSDTEIVESSRSRELLDNSEDLALPQPTLIQGTSIDLEQTRSETEIYKPSISDDSKDEREDCARGQETSNEEHTNQEADTLPDTLLLRSGRTYLGSRRRCVREEVPSSSVLEEISEIGQASQPSSAIGNEAIEIPSSPPTVLIDRRSPRSSYQEKEISTSQEPVSEANRSDSQQATVQLQQESHQQSRGKIPSSQASTASIPSSPAIEQAKPKQAAPSRRGWFFNPLTDSQLLPDSIMNFELPRLPKMLGLGRVASGEDDDGED